MKLFAVLAASTFAQEASVFSGRSMEEIQRDFVEVPEG